MNFDKESRLLSIKVLIVVFLLPFFASCVSQRPVSTELSYKNEYFDLLHVNQKYALENKKLKYQNNKLLFNNFIDDALWNELNYDSSYFTKVLEYKKEQNTKLNKLFNKVTKVVKKGNVKAYINNENIILSFDNRSLFLESGYILKNETKGIFDFLTRQMVINPEIEVEIVNFIDNDSELDNLYFRDIYDLASHSNNQIRRYLIENGSISSYRVLSRINNIEHNNIGHTELILQFKNNFYLSSLSSIK